MYQPFQLPELPRRLQAMNLHPGHLSFSPRPSAGAICCLWPCPWTGRCLSRFCMNSSPHGIPRNGMIGPRTSRRPDILGAVMQPQLSGAPARPVRRSRKSFCPAPGLSGWWSGVGRTFCLGRRRTSMRSAVRQCCTVGTSPPPPGGTLFGGHSGWGPWCRRGARLLGYWCANVARAACSGCKWDTSWTSTR